MIKQKQGICTKCSRLTYIYAKKMCSTCYWKTKAQEKRSGTGEKFVFEKVYDASKGKCFITGKFISKENAKASNFLHVLAKGQNKYPKFKLYQKNILFVVAEFHELYDHGTKEILYKLYDKEKLDAVFKLKDELIDEYKKLD